MSITVNRFDDDFVPVTENIQLETSNSPSNALADSEIYLAKLERKLTRLKSNNNKEPKPKDMLSTLHTVRDDYMSHLNSSSDPTTFLPDTDVDDKEITNSYLERKLFPQKNALTYEELQHLLEADVLAKLSMENIPTTEKSTGVTSDKNIER